MMSLIREILAVLKLVMQWLIGPGEKVKWEKEYKRLQNEYEKRKQAYCAMLAGGGTTATDDVACAFNAWVSISKTLNAHRLAGQRQGFISGPK